MPNQRLQLKRTGEVRVTELGMCLLALFTWYWAILRPFVAASMLLATLLPSSAKASDPSPSSLPELLLVADSGWLMLRDDVTRTEAERWVVGEARLEKPADLHWRVRQRVDLQALSRSHRALLGEPMIGYGANGQSCPIELAAEAEVWHEDASWRGLAGDDEVAARAEAVSEIRLQRAGRLVVRYTTIGSGCDAVLWARPQALPRPRLWFADEESSVAHEFGVRSLGARAELRKLAVGYQKFAQAQPEFAAESFETWRQTAEQRQLWRPADGETGSLLHASVGFESAPCEPRFEGGWSHWVELKGSPGAATKLHIPADIRAHDVVAVFDLRRDGHLGLLVRGEFGRGLTLIESHAAGQRGRFPTLSSEVEFYGCRC